MFYSPGARIKKWLTLGVNLTHLIESRYLFFLKSEVVDNIFQWEVLKIRWQIKVGMFQSIRALTVHKILKTRISSKNSCKMTAFSCLLSNALI